jgi:hypothetical protein
MLRDASCHAELTQYFFSSLRHFRHTSAYSSKGGLMKATFNLSRPALEIRNSRLLRIPVISHAILSFDAIYEAHLPFSEKIIP